MAEPREKRIVALPGRAAGAPSPADVLPARGNRLGRHPYAISYGLLVLVPALLTALYLGFFASDRFVSGAGFAVRGMGSSGGADLVGSITGLPSSGSTTSDSFIILNYLESRDLVRRLEDQIDLRDTFGAAAVDPLFRLAANRPVEDVVDYWSQRIDTNFDNTSGIITFEVQAFTPASAQAIAAAVLEACRDLVNDLSQQARQDAVANALEEVTRAETRLSAAREALMRFRQTQRALDPTAVAKLQLELIGSLDQQLAELEARMAALSGAVAPDSPAFTALKRQATALEQQIIARRNEIGTAETSEAGPDESLTRQLASYEELEIERTFAQEAYASALTSLETARAEADRQQRYLALYSAPALPEQARYPNRVLTPVLTLVVLSLIWAVGSLVVLSVRDHLA